MSAPFMSVWQGFLIMVCCITIGFIMSFMGGLVMDKIVDTYEANNLWIDVPTEWDQSRNISFLGNMYMFLMYLIPVMGILSFVVTIFWRQQYDAYLYR
jgi:hypothetical protein